MASQDADEQDPIRKALERSTIAQTLKAARASLAEPSRPFTPLDRSLFQHGDSSASRPSSSYSVDQLAFVRDTYGNRPESARSSRSSRSRAFEPIQEETSYNEGNYRHEGGADVLEIGDEGGGSSGSEELTPVTTTSAPSGAPTPPARVPARPPRPPAGAGGYPSAASSLRPTGGGYPSTGAHCPEAPASPQHTVPRERRRSGSRHRTIIDDSPTRSKSGEMSSPGQRRKTSRSPAPPGNGDSQAWDVECEGLLGELQKLSESEASSEVALELSQRVWSLVSHLQGCDGNSRTAAKLLRGVLGLMDLKDTKCLFKLSRSALALLQVEGAINGVHSTGVQAAYLNVAKVLFKLSKNEGQDKEFLKEDLIMRLLEILQSNAPECTNSDLRVYVLGVLKNISNEEANQKFLIQQGAISTLFGLTDLDQLTGSSKEAQLLIQITATLRNLAASSDNEELMSQKAEEQFLQEDRLSALTRMMALFPSQIELLTNISRLLAKLTLHESVCEAIGKNDAHLRQIAQTLSTCADSAPLALRLGFALGNLTARSDRIRIVFSFDCEGTTLVPQLLRRYWQKDRQLALLELDAGKASGAQEVQEVLVKLVRLLANISISPSAGAVLAASSAVVDPLLDMLGAKRIGDSEELVLNVVSAVTNLLFYDVPSNLFILEDNKQLLCRLFRPLLLESYNDEALQETARALGNLSRHDDARKCMRELRIDEILVILLNHDDRDLVYYVCGALVNLATDTDCVARLTSTCPVVEKLEKLLVDADDVEDAALQLVAVKVLTNLSIHPSVQWSKEETEGLQSALGRVVASASELRTAEDETERQQLLELARALLGTLGPALTTTNGNAQDSPTKKDGLALQAQPASNEAPGRREDGLFLCQVPGCGRRFKTQEKLSEHSERRHGAKT